MYDFSYGFCEPVIILRLIASYNESGETEDRMATFLPVLWAQDLDESVWQFKDNPDLVSGLRTSLTLVLNEMQNLFVQKKHTPSPSRKASLGTV